MIEGEVKWDNNGEKWIYLDKRLTTTKMVILLEDSGKWVMKSKETESHIWPGIRSHCNKPYRVRLKSLPAWHTEHAWRNPWLFDKDWISKMC